MAKRILTRLLVLVALALAAAVPAAALDAGEDAGDLAQQYRELGPSVWERVALDGRVERLAAGPEGLAWALTRLHEQSNRELDLYLREPSAERWARIQGLADTAARIRADVSAARPLGLETALRAIAAQAASCPYSYSRSADAYPLNPGAGASSSASWWNQCGWLGEVYCWAYAEVGAIHDSESKSGSSASSVSRSCSASVGGSGNCYSEAYAYVYVSALGLFADAEDYNAICGTPPLSVSLNCSQPGPGQGYPQVNCTGSASGGAPPYRAYWRYNSNPEFEAFGSPGLGPWTRSEICKYLTPGFEQWQLRLRVVDGNGAQQTRSFFCGLQP